jgi:hypothetical protein
MNRLGWFDCIHFYKDGSTAGTGVALLHFDQPFRDAVFVKGMIARVGPHDVLVFFVSTQTNGTTIGNTAVARLCMKHEETRVNGSHRCFQIITSLNVDSLSSHGRGTSSTVLSNDIVIANNLWISSSKVWFENKIVEYKVRS